MSIKQSIIKGKNKKQVKHGKLFCIIIISLLLAQWAVFFVFSRINSILSSFQEYDGQAEKFVFLSFDNLFVNYTKFFNELINNPNTLEYIFNGYKFWFFSFMVGNFSILIAFYIYKKFPGHTVMMMILLLPGTLAGIANPKLFMYFVEKALPVIAKDLNWSGDWTLLFSRPETAVTTALVMSAFLAFPGSMLFYTAQFSSIPQEQVEAAQLDGITFIKEFWYIALPSIFNIWALTNLTILTAGLTTLGPGYTLYMDQGYQYGMVTFQYDILINVLGGRGANQNYYFPYSAAINMVLGILGIIGIIIMKRVYKKIDPDIQL